MIECASPVPSSHAEPCFCWLQTLALLLRGGGQRSLLDTWAVSDACEHLLPMLEQGATARSTPRVPCSPMCQAALRRCRAQLLAQAVLHVLDLCLFSSAVMLTSASLRPAALRLLCAVYRLACLPQRRGRHGMDSPPELALIGKLPLHGFMLQREAASSNHLPSAHRPARCCEQEPEGQALKHNAFSP